MYGNSCLIHQKLDLISLFLRAFTGKKTVHGAVVAANDLLTGSFFADFIVTDAVTSHVNTHVCW